MALTAEFQLRSPELPLVDVAAAAPDTDIDDRVTIEIKSVQENLAFGEAIKRESPFSEKTIDSSA